MVLGDTHSVLPVVKEAGVPLKHSHSWGSFMCRVLCGTGEWAGAVKTGCRGRASPSERKGPGPWHKAGPWSQVWEGAVEPMGPTGSEPSRSGIPLYFGKKRPPEEKLCS